MTAPAPSAPATQPAAPSPAARKLLARLTGQSPAGQSVLVTMEQAISAAATVFLNISTDGADAPTEKFLGVQKARANGRLLAIKKELRAATLERFDEPEPEPEPVKPVPAPARGKTATPAKGKTATPAPAKGKTAPAAPTASVRTRDQITVIKERGRYAALMIVGPSSRYEVVRDHGLPTVERLWEEKATRSWQPQQRAAKEKVDEFYATDPSEPVAVAEPAPVVEPVAEPVAEPAPVVEPAAEPVAEPAPVAEPVAEPVKKGGPRKAKKETPKEVEPDDDGPAL